MAAVVKVGSLAGAIASASYVLARNPASADKNVDVGSFFSGGASSSSAAAVPAAAATPQQEKPRNDQPRTSAAGFDPEALERGAKALREINASNHAKKVTLFLLLIILIKFWDWHSRCSTLATEMFFHCS